MEETMEDNKPVVDKAAPDKKGIAAMLIADMGKKSDSEPMESDENEGMESCAEEMMSALDSRDVKAFMSALNAFIDQR